MKSKIKVLFAPTFLLLFFQVALAQNYYVSNSGDDSNDGMSEAAPWRTIDKVNSFIPSPGDSILFKRGDTWRIIAYRGIQIKASGLPDPAVIDAPFDPDKETYKKYITYGAYGNATDPKPRLIGSTKVEGWKNVNGNIWQAPLSYNPINRENTYGGELYFEYSSGDIGFGVGFGRDGNTSLSQLTKEYDSLWNADTIYLYSEGDPSTKYDAIEAPYTPTIIFTNNKDYLAFDNLEIGYGLEMGIGDAGNPGTHYGLKVTNNHIHHIGRKGSGKAYGLSLRRSHMLIEKNDIHDCGRRNISLNLYSSDQDHILMEYVTIRHNYLHEGWHTTGIDTINSGRATGTSHYHTQRYIYVYNNLFEDDKYNELDEDGKYNKEREHDQTSNFMYVTADPGNTSEYIYIFNNIFKNAKGKGIALDGVDNVYIFNNTFYGIAQNILFSTSLNSISASDLISGDGVYRFHIGNNIFYNDSLEARPQYTTPLFIKTGMVKNAEFIDYNLYYATPTSRKRLVNVYSPATSTNDTVNDVFTMANFFEWPLYDKYSDPGFDDHSPAPSDPLFVNPEANDFRVREGSLAIGAGMPIAWITNDYYGNPRDPKHPTLGAIEYISIPPPMSNSAFWNLMFPAITNSSNTKNN